MVPETSTQLSTTTAREYPIWDSKVEPELMFTRDMFVKDSGHQTIAVLRNESDWDCERL